MQVFVNIKASTVRMVVDEPRSVTMLQGARRRSLFLIAAAASWTCPAAGWGLTPNMPDTGIRSIPVQSRPRVIRVGHLHRGKSKKTGEGLL